MAGTVELATHSVLGVYAREESAKALKPAAEKPPKDEKKEQMELNHLTSEKQKKEEAGKLAEGLSAVAKAVDRNLKFSVDDKTGRIVIKVMNGDTGEVIREIPSEEALKMQQSVSSVAGLIFEEQT